MPIPFLIGGAALATGLFGAKKGLDARNNYAKAKSIVDDAVNDFETSKESLETEKQRTSKELKLLGKVRLEAEGTLLKRFVTVVKPINHVTHTPITLGGTQVHLKAPDIVAMELSAYQAADLLKDGVGALSSGVLAGIGASGLASTIGVASTGTAISTLSGVAATNATLAWLGGGSLASGGMGMAGGAAVLGGAIAGPVIAIMGMSAAKKSEKALTEAFQRESEIREVIEQVENGIVALSGIHDRAQELRSVIMAVSKRFGGVLVQAEAMIGAKQAELAERQQASAQEQQAYEQKNILVRLWARLSGRKPDFSFANPLDFGHFSEQEKSLYTMLASGAYALNSLLRVKVLDEGGTVTHESEQAISDGKILLRSM